MRRVVLALAILFGSAMELAAQRPRPAQAPGAERSRLEAQVRREFARAVQQRVGLSPDQMLRLRGVTQKYATERRRLQMEERASRLALQETIRGGPNADTAAVERHLQILVDVQKRRAQLLEAEQRDLGGIMTPLQRAKFMALQEQTRRRLEQRRNDAAGQAPPRGQGPPPL